MSVSREYYPDGKLKRLIQDNRDKSLNLSLESLSRQVPNDVARIEYKEFDAQDVQTFSFSRNRDQLLNMVDTYSFVYDFAYYPDGEIDTIRIRVYDASDPPNKLRDRTIKHYLDGKQPEAI